MQEAGRRAGTENVLGIVGLGAAAELVHAEQEAAARHMAAMRDDLQDSLLCNFPQVLPVNAACEGCILLLLLAFFPINAIITSMHCSLNLAEVLGGGYMVKCQFCSAAWSLQVLS